MVSILNLLLQTNRAGTVPHPIHISLMRYAVCPVSLPRLERAYDAHTGAYRVVERA